MLDLNKIYTQVLTESKASHLKHLFEDGTMTFDDMRNIFKNVFQGKVYVTPKVKSLPFAITYKDGNFALSNGDKALKDPMTVEKVCSTCKCKGAAKDALLTTIGQLVNKLSKLDQTELNSMFANGQNYYTFDVVVPPEDQLGLYGNKCFIQKNKLNSYDAGFQNLTEDEEQTAKLDEFLGQDVEQCISDDNIKRLQASYSPDKALAEVLADLEKLVDGIGYKAKINDFVTDQYSKLIVNCALKHGIDLYRNSDFVNELIARLSYIFTRKPNKGDLLAYAKHDGIDIKNQALREMIEWLDDHSEEINAQIIKPVERLVLKAGVLVMKCFLGLVAADPCKTSQKLVGDLDETIAEMEKDEELTPQKIKMFRKNMKKLDDYQTSLPADGILIMHKGKVCKICGKFGMVNNIMKLMNY